MGCLTDAEFAASTLGHDCVLLERVRTADGAGGTTVALVQAEETRCDITAASRSLDRIKEDIADKLSGREAYTYALPIDSVASNEHIIGVEGRTFEILSVTRSLGGTVTKGVCAEL